LGKFRPRRGIRGAYNSGAMKELLRLAARCYGIVRIFNQDKRHRESAALRVA